MAAETYERQRPPPTSRRWSPDFALARRLRSTVPADLASVERMIPREVMRSTGTSPAGARRSCLEVWCKNIAPPRQARVGTGGPSRGPASHFENFRKSLSQVLTAPTYMCTVVIDCQEAPWGELEIWN